VTEKANGHVRPPKSDRPMDRRLHERPGLTRAGEVAPHGGVERTEFFGRLRIPMVNGTGKKGS
jgi:hypothetical protein